MSPLDCPGVYREILESLHIGVYVVDRERRIVFWNRGAEQISGFLGQEVLGRSCRDEILVHCDNENVVLCAERCPLLETMRDGKPSSAEIFLRHKAGHRVPVHMRVIPIKDEHGNVLGAAETFEEPKVSACNDRRNPNTPQSLNHVTGLPGDKASRSALEQHLAAYREHRIAFSLLRVHVDRLSQFMANHGADAGGQLLRIVAQTLRNALRPSDFVGCWAEHEFVIILNIHRQKALTRVAERLRAISSCAGIRWWGDQLSVTLSLGASVVEPEDTVETLLQRADRGLDRSVEAGGNRLTFVPSENEAVSKDGPCS